MTYAQLLTARKDQSMIWQGSLTQHGGSLSEPNLGLTATYRDFSGSGAFLGDSPLMIIGSDWHVGQSWAGWPETVGDLVAKLESLPAGVVKFRK